MRTTFLFFFLLLTVISCGGRKNTTSIVKTGVSNNSDINGSSGTSLDNTNNSLNAPSTSATTPAAVINFGTIPVDNKITKAIGYTNSGAAKATNLQVTLNSNQFTIDNSMVTDKCGSTLNSGQTCYVYVSFKPDSATNFSASLILDFHDGVQTQKITKTLNGLGTITPMGVLALNVATTNQVDYESVASGSRKSKSFTLTNVGNANVSNINMWLPNADFFKFESPNTSLQCNRVSGVLSPGESCNLEVSFGATLPTTAVADVDVTYPLAINYNDGQAPRSSALILSGKVIAPPPLLTASVNGSASNITVDYGANVTLSWIATNAKSCNVTSPISAALSLSGSYPVNNLIATTTFSMTCIGAHSNITKSLTVVVNPLDCNSSKAIASNESSGIVWTDNRNPVATRYEQLRAAGVTSGPRFYNPWYGGGDGINIYADADTIRKACNILGYANGVGVSVGSHRSPGDNAVMKWNNSSKQFDLFNSRNFNWSAFNINCTGKLNTACYSDQRWIFR